MHAYSISKLAAEVLRKHIHEARKHANSVCCIDRLIFELEHLARDSPEGHITIAENRRKLLEYSADSEYVCVGFPATLHNSLKWIRFCHDRKSRDVWISFKDCPASVSCSAFKELDKAFNDFLVWMIKLCKGVMYETELIKMYYQWDLVEINYCGTIECNRHCRSYFVNKWISKEIIEGVVSNLYIVFRSVLKAIKELKRKEQEQKQKKQEAESTAADWVMVEEILVPKQLDREKLLVQLERLAASGHVTVDRDGNLYIDDVAFDELARLGAVIMLGRRRRTRTAQSSTAQ